MQKAKVKLLVFVPTFPVFTETFIERELAKLVARENLDVTVLALKNGTASITETLKPCVTYKELKLLTFFEVVTKSFLVYLAMLPKLAGAYKLLQDSTSVSPKSAFAKIFLLFRVCAFYAPLIKTFTPDFILVQFFSEMSTVAMLVAYFLNIPYAISAHARDVFEFGEYATSKVKTAKFISICNKKALESCILQSGVANPKNVILRYHGIDFAKYPETLFEPTKPLKLLTIARYTEKKGHRYLLEACNMLKAQGVDFTLELIGGGGELYAETKELVSQLGLTTQVHFVNDGKEISFEETLPYFKSAQIYVFPSIVSAAGDSDGIANVLVEAALFKLPVVATNAGSTTELIEHGVTGLVVAQKDPKALAEAIMQLATKPAVRESLATQNYLKAKKMFDLDKNIADLEKMIQSEVSLDK